MERAVVLASNALKYDDTNEASSDFLVVAFCVTIGAGVVKAVAEILAFLIPLRRSTSTGSHRRFCSRDGAGEVMTAWSGCSFCFDGSFFVSIVWMLDFWRQPYQNLC
jgi:hypothetical protein